MTEPVTLQDLTAVDPEGDGAELRNAPFVLTEPARGCRVLSGIQPSGTLHMGNYFGAQVQHIEAQDHNDCMFFIASYHALTSVRDGGSLRRATLDVAMDYLALGLDPERVALYRQHDLPQVTALAWILSCLCPMGDLERSVSYKSKVANGLPAQAGLFNYPILMAADILIVNADVVPVGQDQLQNIELARRMASRFNQAYGVELFKLPMAQLNDTRVVPGLDGGKMSKSHGNTIPIFATPEELRVLVGGIKTDSLPAAAPKDPEACNIFKLLRLVATPDELADWAARYRAGGLRYTAVKARLSELLDQRFAQARERRRDLQARPWVVEDVLQSGAMKAARLATPVIERVLDLVGLDMPCLGPLLSVAGAAVSVPSARRGWGI